MTSGLSNEDAGLAGALLEGYPAGFARVLFSEIHGRFAVALIDVGGPQMSYRFQSVSERSPDEKTWIERTTGNGPGVTFLEDDVSVLTWWGEAPDGTSGVQIEYGDGLRVVAEVRSGAFFHCRWDLQERAALRALPPVVLGSH